MNDRSTHGLEPPDEATIERMREKRWREAMNDVPAGFGDDDLRRAIAASSKRQADSLRMISGWIVFIGFCVGIIMIVVVLAAFGGITVEFSPVL